MTATELTNIITDHIDKTIRPTLMGKALELANSITAEDVTTNDPATVDVSSVWRVYFEADAAVAFRDRNKVSEGFYWMDIHVIKDMTTLADAADIIRMTGRYRKINPWFALRMSVNEGADVAEAFINRRPVAAIF